VSRRLVWPTLSIRLRIIIVVLTAVLGLIAIYYSVSACALLMGGPCRTCGITADIAECRVPAYAGYLGWGLLGASGVAFVVSRTKDKMGGRP
jgi:hypothetical protein